MYGDHVSLLRFRKNNQLFCFGKKRSKYSLLARRILSDNPVIILESGNRALSGEKQNIHFFASMELTVESGETGQ